MATGVLPFRGEASGVVAESILNRTPVAPGRLNHDVPAKLEEIIHKALEKDRKLRYQRAGEIRTDLQRLKRDSDSGRVSIAPADEFILARRAAFPLSARWGIAVATLVVLSFAAVVEFNVGGIREKLLPTAHALTNKDTIVLADFMNTTGDSVFDGTLRQGLSVQLEQSPFLNLVSDDRIQHNPNPCASVGPAMPAPEMRILIYCRAIVVRYTCKKPITALDKGRSIKRMIGIKAMHPQLAAGRKKRGGVEE